MGQKLRDWIRGSAIKSTGYISLGPVFDFQHPHRRWQPFLITVTRNLSYSSGLYTDRKYKCYSDICVGKVQTWKTLNKSYHLLLKIFILKSGGEWLCGGSIKKKSLTTQQPWQAQEPRQFLWQAYNRETPTFRKSLQLIPPRDEEGVMDPFNQ